MKKLDCLSIEILGIDIPKPTRRNVPCSPWKKKSSGNKRPHSPLIQKKVAKWVSTNHNPLNKNNSVLENEF